LESGNPFQRRGAEKSTDVEIYQKITKSFKSLKYMMEIHGKTVKTLHYIRKIRFFTGKLCGNFLIFAVISLDENSKYVLICIRVSAPACRCTTIIIPDAIWY